MKFMNQELEGLRQLKMKSYERFCDARDCGTESEFRIEFLRTAWECYRAKVAVVESMMNRFNLEFMYGLGGPYEEVMSNGGNEE